MTLFKKNIRVLFIESANQAPMFEKARPNGTLAPIYLIGALRQRGIEVDYLDATIGQRGRDLKETFYNTTELENGNHRYGMNPNELSEIFSKYDIIATSSSFTVQTRMHFEIASIAKKVEKEISKHILVISGGVNARALREHFLSNGFDIIALGEGEETIVQIVDQFSCGKPDYSKVERIAFRKDGKTIITSALPRKRTKFLDHIPQPAMDVLPLNVYQKIGIPHSGAPIPGTKFTQIQTSRGCQDKCTFCHISQEKKDRELVGNIGFLKMFSNERVGEDIDQAIKLGVTRLYIEDDNLFFNKKRLIKLSPYLKRKGLSYSALNGANMRFLLHKVNNKYEPDVDFINLLADFGLNELMLPFETKSNEMIKKYASGKYDPDKMNPIGTIKAVKKAGIRACSAFLIGFRDQSWESILETKKFAKELFAEGLDHAGFAIPVPYPGTLDFEYEMKNTDTRNDFDKNLLKYTDHMWTRGLPLFPTKAPAKDLVAAVRDFWFELNPSSFTKSTISSNISARQLPNTRI